MYSDADQNKSSNIPRNGSKEEANNEQKPTHAKATAWKTSHPHRSSFNNRYITLHVLVAMGVVRRGGRISLQRRVYRVGRRRRRRRVVLEPKRRSRLGEPDRRLRELAGRGRGPEGAVLVVLLLMIRRRRRRESGGGGGGRGGVALAVGAGHLAAHGAGCGEGLLRLGNRDAGGMKGSSGVNTTSRLGACSSLC